MMSLNRMMTEFGRGKDKKKRKKKFLGTVGTDAALGAVGGALVPTASMLVMSRMMPKGMTPLLNYRDIPKIMARNAAIGATLGGVGSGVKYGAGKLVESGGNLIEKKFGKPPTRRQKVGRGVKRTGERLGNYISGDKE